jgi:hypothetical protein
LKEFQERGARGVFFCCWGWRGTVPRESWELVSKEKKELEDVVKQKEKQKLRQRQVSFFPPPSSLDVI